MESHLLQMRGLKQYMKMYREILAGDVASFTDAWIETILREGVYTEIWVASFTDAWIETARTSLPRKARRGRIFYRCVD